MFLKIPIFTSPKTQTPSFDKKKRPFISFNVIIEVACESDTQYVSTMCEREWEMFLVLNLVVQIVTTVP